MSPLASWPATACLLIFVFLTGSGSRRAYYVLPILPFAALMIAEWLRAEAGERWQRVFAWTAAAAFLLMLVWFAVVVPVGFRYGGERLLARQVRAQAEEKAPWSSWHILICGAPPAAGYYFRTATEARVVAIEDVERVAGLVAAEPRTIVLTKRRFLETVRAQVPSAVPFAEESRLPRFLRGRARFPTGYHRPRALRDLPRGNTRRS